MRREAAFKWLDKGLELGQCQSHLLQQRKRKCANRLFGWKMLFFLLKGDSIILWVSELPENNAIASFLFSCSPATYLLRTLPSTLSLSTSPRQGASRAPYLDLGKVAVAALVGAFPYPAVSALIQLERIRIQQLWLCFPLPCVPVEAKLGSSSISFLGSS